MKYLIFGYGVTGKSVEKYLSSKGEVYFIYDDDEKNLKNIEESKLYVKNKINEIDEVIISPGIKPDHELLQKLISKRVSIKTDIDIFSSIYSGKIIGVTGNNGKTTFVNELTKFLNLNMLPSVAVGNIGVSPLDIIPKEYEYVVLELSSYQLHYCTKLNLDIAVILNIFPDHIDWHGKFVNYVNSKLKIFTFLDKDKDDRKIIGSNAGIIKKNLPKTLNLNSPTNKNVHEELLLSLGEAAKLIGGEDLFNSYIKYIEVNNINYPHRMEQFLNLKNKNISFFNDSKATNYHAVSEATKLFSSQDRECILILHGITKETDENKLNVDSIVNHIVIPKDMNINLGTNNANITYIENIYDIKVALENLLSDNQIVLFSCGGSSFNDFQNYQDRGNYFKKIILSMDIEDA